jgi:predicted RNA methylase
VVLDVGSGCGVLAFMSAKAGAKHVYAVESSSTYKLVNNFIFLYFIDRFNKSVRRMDSKTKSQS